jgi:hypothetical protein
LLVGHVASPLQEESALAVTMPAGGVLPGLLRGLVALAALCGPGVVSADTIGTFKDRHGTIDLTSQPCAGATAGEKRAQATGRRGTRTGCWSVGTDGHPVVRWSDGRRQHLDGNRVRLSAKYRALLEDAPQAAPASRFPRPGWCARAHFPHEQRICGDPQLAAADLQLAPLWRTFKTRRRLSVAEQAWHKSDFFARLKACGDSKACIDREQRVQRAMYEAALR